MKKTLLLIIFLCITNFSFADSLTATVDRDEIGISETFVLTLRYDEQINASPDYSLLSNDFEILNNQTGRQSSIINGQVSASTEWRLTLAPKRIGKLIIPSFNINGQFSEAIEISVDKQSLQAKITGNDPVMVEVETDKDSVYAQEQIILTIRLLTTVNLSGAQLDPLSIPDTFVSELDEKSYNTRINNKPGAIIEKRFAIFPQKSGKLTIPALRYQVVVDDGDIWSRMSGNGQIVRLMTDEKILEVKPAPDSQQWLPATQLTISEHWSASIQDLKPGEPISRTVTVTAKGLTAAQIPPLSNTQVEGLTFYQDQAQTDDQKTKLGIQGSRIETTAIVPSKPGQYTLPEINLRWWNTDTQSFEVAKLDAVTLNVTGTATSPINNDTTSAEPISTTPELPLVKEQLIVQTPKWIYGLLALSGLLNLILLFTWLNLRRQFATYLLRKKEDQQKIREKESNAWKRIKENFDHQNLIELRIAIIEWAKIYWKDETISSLDHLGLKAKDTELQKQLTQLDSALFGTNTATFNISALKATLINLRTNKKTEAKREEKLEELYPD